MSIPNDLKYTSDHEWVRDEGSVLVIGITQHAQEALGDVVFVDLPQVGATIAQGATFGVVESTKAASDLFAPVSGEVVETNGALTDDPQAINGDPYHAGWMIKVKPSNPRELSALLSADAYAAHIAAS